LRLFWAMNLRSNIETFPQKEKKKICSTQRGTQKIAKQSSSRVQVEHIIRKQKIFRILGERYRNRRKRFRLRVNLIEGIYNYELYNVFD